MRRTTRFPRTVLTAAVLLAASLVGSGTSWAQPSAWHTPVFSGGFAPEMQQRPAAAVARGPLARLVKNPHTADGSPPFALADQAGTIQRLVEPVPGIELGPYVGQVVVVRHDTGRTILATQIELPPLPLLPMVGDARYTTDGSASGDFHALSFNSREQTAQFIDNDDTTTQIISDDESLLKAGQSPSSNTGGATNPSQTGINAAHPSSRLMPLDLSVDGPQFGEPMFVDGMPPEAMGMQSWPHGFVEGSNACPECGEYHGQAGCDPMMQAGPNTRLSRIEQRFQDCRLYADAEIYFFRVHLMEGAVGKLREKYEFSPRFTVGFDGTGLVDGRARYWIYERSTSLLSGDSVRVEFNVFDLEATHRFQAGRSNVGLSVGMRIAGIDLVDDDGDAVGTDLLGMTLAADAHTPLCNFADGTVSWVYGGRLSILGGDWGGNPGSDFLPAPLQDDNVVAEEIYIGVEFAVGYRECDLRARLAFEMQNWHSDALAQNAGSDSIGFIGPGFHIGAAF